MYSLMLCEVQQQKLAWKRHPFSLQRLFESWESCREHNLEVYKPLFSFIDSEKWWNLGRSRKCTSGKICD